MISLSQFWGRRFVRGASHHLRENEKKYPFPYKFKEQIKCQGCLLSSFLLLYAPIKFETWVNWELVYLNKNQLFLVRVRYQEITILK